MNRSCSRATAGLMLLISVVLIGGVVGCGKTQSFDVTYYYLPG